MKLADGWEFKSTEFKSDFKLFKAHCSIAASIAVQPEFYIPLKNGLKGFGFNLLANAVCTVELISGPETDFTTMNLTTGT